MDPKTLNLILFLEQMAGLVVKGVVDLKGVISGSGGKSVDEILADADSTYQQIIANATNPPTP